MLACDDSELNSCPPSSSPALAWRTAWVTGGSATEGGPADGVDAVATTRHGNLWRHAGDLSHLAEDVAYLPAHGHRLIVTGESGEVAGTSVGVDGGHSWTRVSEAGHHALDCTRDGSCWASGGSGRVARLVR